MTSSSEAPPLEDALSSSAGRGLLRPAMRPAPDIFHYIFCQKLMLSGWINSSLHTKRFVESLGSELADLGAPRNCLTA